MYLEQDGRCALCGKKFISLCVDHNHSTKIVRGLLCRPCNYVLALLESEEIMARVIEYLKHGTTSLSATMEAEGGDV